MRRSGTFLLVLEAGSEGHRDNCETFGNEPPDEIPELF